MAAEVSFFRLQNLFVHTLYRVIYRFIGFLGRRIDLRHKMSDNVTFYGSFVTYLIKMDTTESKMAAKMWCLALFRNGRQNGQKSCFFTILVIISAIKLT